MSSDREILALEDKRYAAMCGGDFAALEAMLHDELLYTHSSGLTDTKATPPRKFHQPFARSQRHQSRSVRGAAARRPPCRCKRRFLSWMSNFSWLLASRSARSR